MAFLKAILQGKKKILKIDQIKHIHYPQYRSLSVKQLYEFAFSEEEIRAYLPEGKMLGAKKYPEKDFFMGILSTIKEAEMKALVNEELDKRFGLLDQTGKNIILVDEKWEDQLLKMPFHSCNFHTEVNTVLGRKGRATQLLKEKVFKRDKNETNIGEAQNFTKRRKIDQVNLTQTEDLRKWTENSRDQ